MTKADIFFKIHLVVSVIIVIPVALIYGFKPGLFLDIHLQTIDEQNFFKAVMGLYLGFSLLWILGIFKSKHLKTALITNLIFMLSMGFGRFTSILFDGTPSIFYVLGTVGELILGFYGLWILSSKYSKKP